MVLNDKVCITFDIEVLVNCFTCTFYNTETLELRTFEISERKNEITDLIKVFSNPTGYYFVGYNNIHYDNPIINYCIEFFSNTHLKWNEITQSIFNLSKTIVDRNGNLDSWKRWKYATKFSTIDLLTMMYSQALRVSLKELQVTMMFKNVMEMNHDWDKPIELADIDQLIKYNINDVLSTSELLTRCENDLKLRLDIETQYGISCLSKDGVGIGSEILKSKYLQKTQLEWKDIQHLRSPMDLIPLRDIILPQIEYNTPVLKELLKTLKNSTVSPGRKGIEKHFILDGVKVSVGVGGIHSKPKPSVIIPNEDELLLDTDAASLYPSLLIEYGFYPPHLGREFVEIYSGVKNERIEAKRNKDKGKDDTLKLALNAVTGNLQNEYSWMYSPFAVMQIRMNGQLLLLKLAEMLIEIGCTIIQYNTDGLFLLCKKASKDLYDDTIRKFEQFSRLVMETTEFKSMYQYAINDYLAVGSNDSIKEKGLFITKVTPGKGLTPKIIPKAIQAFLIHNIPIEKTILESSDIKDFLMSEKTGKQWTVEFHGIRQQRINRFYACKKGLNLFKWKELNTHIIQDSTPVVTLWGELKSVDIPLERQYQNMLSNSPVSILNVLEDKPIDSYAINYQYYVTEARKIIDELIPKQLTLF